MERNIGESRVITRGLFFCSHAVTTLAPAGSGRRHAGHASVFSLPLSYYFILFSLFMRPCNVM